MKKITSCLSIIIVAAMLFSMMPLNVFAAGSTESSSYSEQGSTANASVTNNNLTVSGNNSFGDLLTEAINNADNSDSPTEGYSVTGISMDGKTATVDYKAIGDCTLLVAVYTDDGVKMLGSGKKTVSAEEKTVDVSVSIDTMPQYYLLKAFLVNPENNYPLSNVFVCELYTQAIQEVKNSTVDDYEDREVLNLDDNEDTNFAVYGNDVTIIDDSVASNTYLPDASDPDNGKYVFGNADSSFASMNVGDTFSYDKDGELIIAKVKSIEVTTNADGSKTVTVYEDEDSDITDFFDYVKIENNEKIDSYELDDSVADDCVSEITENSSKKSAPKRDGQKGLSVEDQKDFVDIHRHINKKKKFGSGSTQGYVELDVDLKLKITFKVVAYSSFKNSYVDMSINSDGKLHGTVTGHFSADINLPSVEAKFAGGAVRVGFEPTFKFSATAKITIDASFEYKVGFNCSIKNGLVDTSDPNPTVDFGVKIEGELYFGFEFAPYVTIIEVGTNKKSHSLAKIKIPVEVGLKVTGVMKYPSTHACQSCIDGDFYIHVELNPTVMFLVKENMSSEHAKKTFTKELLNKDFKVGDWYYSIDHDELGFGDCPYKDIISTGSGGDNVTYTLYNNGLLEFAGSGEIGYYNDDYYHPWLDKSDKIKKVNIKNGINGIASYAFKDCYCLTSITIPKSVTSIWPHNSPFDGCSSFSDIYYDGSEADWKKIVDSEGSTVYTFGATLHPSITDIVIPDTVTTINSWEFSYCTTITSVTIPESVLEIGSCSFYGCTGLKNITIPDSVIKIGNSAFSGCTGLTSVTVPTSVKTIGESVFDGCTKLKDATISYSGRLMFNGCNSLTSVAILSPATSIYNKAFYNCISLTNITIPQSVTYIGSEAFSGCSSLTDVYYEGTQADWKKVDKSYSNIYGTVHFSATSLIIPDSVTTISDYEYSNCSDITSVVIPDSVIEIGKGAFSGCTGLTSITIPDSVIKIGDSAFSGCTGLTSIIVPSSVKSIGSSVFSGCTGLKSATTVNVSDYMFSGCSYLKNVTVQNQATYIYSYAFKNCISLTSINIPKSMQSISAYNNPFDGCSSFTDIYYEGSEVDWKKMIDYDGTYNYTFGATLHPGITDIEIPDTVTAINYGDYNNCSTITSITIPDTVIEIGKDAFSGCTGLTSVTIPDSVIKIGDSAFSGCTSLTDVTVPASVKTIGEYVFGGCTKLKSVTITSAGYKMFSGCSALTNVTFHNSASSIGSYAFEKCIRLSTISIPHSITYISTDAFNNCSSLTDIYYEGSEADWKKVVQSEFSGTYSFGATLHHSVTEVVIPDTVTVINASEYSDCPSIKSVTIPDSVTEIGDYAFSNCTGLTSVTIPNSVIKIGNYAFRGCTALTSVTVPASVKSIGTDVFCRCTGIRSATAATVGNDMFYGCTSLTSVTLQNTVTSIGSSSFRYCSNLSSIAIPKSVTYIGSDAFGGCDALSAVYYEGSEEDWNEVSKSYCGIYCSVYYNSTGPAKSPNPMRSPDSDGTLTSTFENLVPGANYLFVVSKASDPDYILNTDKLLFIDEQMAGEDGTLTFNYQPRVNVSNATVRIFGELKVTSLAVKTEPERLTYIVGDTLDTTGLVLTAVYSDGLEEDITEGFTCTPTDLSTVGTHEITVEYEGQTASFNVKVDNDYTLTASPDSPQKVGTPVTLTAEGGSCYRFYYEQNGKSVTIRDFAAENTCVWTPAAPKDYIIYVDIKDETGKLLAVKGIQYTITDLYSFTLDKDNEQNVGVNMTLTAEGGASYKFYYEYNGAWCNITSNTTGECEWSPKYAGSYMLYVDIKDETGKVIACRTQEFKLNDPFTLTSDAQSTELPYGKTINFTADGGTSYKFYNEKQGDWQRVQDFSKTNTCAWTPTAAGTYNFYCDIKDASGAVVSCKRMTFHITNPYSFTADKETTQPVGTKITFTATGGYQYKFYYEKDGSWVRIQSFTTANTCAWTPTVVGRYNVYCDIADENGTVLAYKGIEFVIGEVGTNDYTFTTGVESPQPMNTAVTLTATGGSSYKFYYEVGGKWATIQNFSTANTATWTPDMIADYTLYVDIKNSSGKVVKTLSKKFSATDPYSFTADVTSPQNIGKSVKFTAAGGASYKFYYQYAGAWVKIQDSTSTTCNWKPNKAGEYMVYVDIKNTSGAVVTCRTMKLVFNDPYRFTTSASSLTQPAGTAISLSANGGASYKFYYEKDGAWVRIQDYSTTKSCTWTPTEAGKYNVFCDIKDASGSVAVCKRITFTITEKCTITASKTNASVGDTITFTATGGSSYKFYYEKDGAWVRIQSFSTSNTCNWKPTAAGDYVVYVDVNDANGNLIGCKGVRCVVG